MKQASGVIERIRLQRVRFVELWFCELSGRPRRVAIAAEHLNENLFKTGLQLDGPSTGPSWDGLIRLLPDPESAYIDPAALIPTLALFCGLDDPKDGRRALLRAEALLAKTGARASIGLEVEFFLMDPVTRAPASETRVWELLRALALSLGRAELEVEGFRHGPAEGQGRVQLRPGAPHRLADQSILYKAVARSHADSAGLALSFLPKPLPGPGAGGMPLHIALWNGSENLFHDARGWALTSPLCRQFAAGLLRHLPALSAFCAPTTNSYRRLGPSSGLEPVLSQAKSTALCRIPARSAAPAARRLKFRLADATANPYLATAACILAGLDGIESKLEPAIETGGETGPAASLHAALSALERGAGFLKRGGAFGDELLGAWKRRLSEMMSQHLPRG